MPKPLVLIVEDNSDIRQNIVEFLESKGYRTDNTDDGMKAFGLISINSYDIVVLDWMLPGLSGIELCRKIKQKGLSLPVLMLSAKAMAEDRIEGLESGADDYLTKPFYLKELQLRIEAILRRSKGEDKILLRVADLEMDINHMLVTREGKPIRLTPTSFKMLRLLMQNSPGIVTREMIEQEVWDGNPPDSDSLRTHLHSLRNAIDKPFNKQLIKTVVGFGWCISGDSL